MIRGREKFLTSAYMISDFFVIQFTFIFSWYLKFHVFVDPTVGFLPFEIYFGWNLLFSIIHILLGFVVSLYTPKRKLIFFVELSKVFQTQVFSSFMLFSVMYIFRVVHVSRWFLFIYFGLSTCFLITYRFLVKQYLRRIRTKGLNKQFVLIIGAGKLGTMYSNEISNHLEYGLSVLGFLDDYHESDGNKKILGKVNELKNILNSNIVDEVVIALPLKFHQKLNFIIKICEKQGVRVTIIPDIYKFLSSTPHFELFAGIPMINVRDVPLDDVRQRYFKRVFDICFSLLVIILILPVMGVICLLIKINSSGPIIFKQERVGMNKRPFNMYKFRSMNNHSQRIADTGWTTENDTRTTTIGKFLRKTSLDELPQFFNVLKGEMSVVGPRPERPFFVEKYKEDIPLYMIKHHVRPGITGWAQVNGFRGDTSIEERIDRDLYYIENWSIIFDVKIILMTFKSGFIHKNAY